MKKAIINLNFQPSDDKTSCARIADDRCLPFEVRAASAITREAIAELEAGKGQRFSNIDDLMANLNADD